MSDINRSPDEGDQQPQRVRKPRVNTSRKLSIGKRLLKKNAKRSIRLPLIKFGSVAVIIFFVFMFIAATFNGIATVGRNATTLADCQSETDGKSVIEAIDKAGTAITEEERKEILESKLSDSSCKQQGEGFSGAAYPVTAGIITAPYGSIDDVHVTRPHAGMDIALRCDTPIYAFAGGTVIKAIKGTEAKSGAGGYAYPAGDVLIKHTEEFSTRYYHLKGSTTTVEVGDVVTAGQQIATQWSNGRTTGCHLHIEAFKNGKLTDMNDYLKACGFIYSSSRTFNEFPEGPVECEGIEGLEPVTPGGSEGGPKGYAKSQLQPIFGLSGEGEFQCLDKLWKKESNWNHLAKNKQSGAYGIPQSLPGTKMASEGADWLTNPETQIRWGMKYIKGRYGTPCKAWEHSTIKGWY